MIAKRTARIGICLLCLLLALAMLAGCQKDTPAGKTPGTQKKPGADTTEEEPEDTTPDDPAPAVTPSDGRYNLTDYDVVYTPSEKNTTILAGMAQTLADRLSVLTERTVTPRTASNISANATAPEILIGKIDARQESVDAYNSIEGTGYTITASGNKICVVGSDHLCTIWALQVFLDDYVTDALTAPEVTITESETVKADSTVAVAGGSAMPIVYSVDCWTRTDHADPGFRSLYSGYDLRSYPYRIADEVVKKLANKVAANTSDFTKKNDATAVSTSGEFFIGTTSRAAERPFLDELKGGEYGFFAANGSAALASWSDIALYPAYEILFNDLIKEAYRFENGNPYVSFPDGFKVKGVYNENWVVDFPKPEGQGISLYNTWDTGDDCLQYLYRGDGINATAFDIYVTRLKNNGYTVITQNQMAENYFATLVNNETGVMLSVAYDAFAHKNEYDYNANPVFDADTEDNYDYDFRFQRCLRIVPCSTSNPKVAVPGSNILTKPANNNAWTWEKVTENAITAVEVLNVGCGYIVTLEDGRFIVIDGGGSFTDSNGVQVSGTKLYEALAARYEQVWGHAPSTNSPIDIAAWVITHSHGDHFWGAYFVMQQYGKTTVRVENLIGNYPAGNVVYPLCNGDNDYMSNTGVAKMLEFTGAKFLKAHTGQTYYFANIRIDVLMTTEDHNPFRVDNSNDTNTVLRFSVYSSPTDNNPYTMIWLGDSNRQQSRWLCAMYGAYLRSDMTSIGHHGNVGCDIELYDTIQANAVWHPHNSGAFSYYSSTPPSTSDSSRYNGRPWRVDQALFGKTVSGDVLPARTYTQYLFFSGNDAGNSTTHALPAKADHITLPFVSGRPDFANIYDTLTGSPISYCTNRNTRALAYKLY